jgi:predicted AAA+ superfamily ATPase
MIAYLRRAVDDELDELLPQLPAVLLDGPKAVGKTETAVQRAGTLVDLTDAAQQQIALQAPAAVLAGEPPIVVDEWQLSPGTWDAVRRRVDADGSGGQFILTGSAPVPGSTTHSGAGRIATLRMRPMTLFERGAARPTVSLSGLLQGDMSDIHGRSELDLPAYVELLLSSGFPGFLNLTGRARRTALDGYLDRIADRDLPELGHNIRHPQTVRRWLAAYAAATATTATWETIRDAATSNQGDKPARTTVTAYTDALQRLRVLDPVPAWLPTRNHLARLTSAAKHHLTDPALAARLVGVDQRRLIEGATGAPALPRDGTFLGALFESLVTLNLRVFAQAAEARVFHLRTKGGRHEVDLIIERDDGKVVAVEVKLAGTVDDDDVKHLQWLRDEIGRDLLDAVVITTGPLAHRREDGVALVPLALLGP